MTPKTQMTHDFHPKPRLSATQTAEYLAANSNRRRSILSEAKFPPVAARVVYTQARAALVGHLVQGQGEGLLESRVHALKRKIDSPETSDFERHTCELCTEAIESFQSAEAGMKVSKMIFSKPGGSFSKLKISGVNISVSIDMLTEKPTSKGGIASGAAMLVFAKSGTMRKNMPERCKTLSLLVYEVLKEQAKPEQIYEPTMCMVIDVIKGVVYRAKGEQRQLLKTIGTSCEEVAARWPSVQPPQNYSGPPVPKL